MLKHDISMVLGMYMSWGQNSACRDLYISCLGVVDFELAMCAALLYHVVAPESHLGMDIAIRRAMPQTLKDTCRHRNQPVSHTLLF